MLLNSSQMRLPGVCANRPQQQQQQRMHMVNLTLPANIIAATSE
jgi:hypothetical protein